MSRIDQIIQAVHQILSDPAIDTILGITTSVIIARMSSKETKPSFQKEKVWNVH